MSLYRNKVKNKNIEVLAEYSRSTFIESRKGEMQQILGNLIGNALDALGDQGKLYLRARLCTSAGTAASALWWPIPAPALPKTTWLASSSPSSPPRKTLAQGLGLWVVKKAVEGAGGTVQIRSRFGRGTVVRVCWPVAPQDVEGLPHLVASSQDGGSGHALNQGSDLDSGLRPMPETPFVETYQAMRA
jgi:signal transduction histidine kinase